MLLRFACLVALSFLIAASHGGAFDWLVHPQTTSTAEALMSGADSPGVEMPSVLGTYR